MYVDGSMRVCMCFSSVCHSKKHVSPFGKEKTQTPKILRYENQKIGICAKLVYDLVFQNVVNSIYLSGSRNK